MIQFYIEMIRNFVLNIFSSKWFIRMKRYDIGWRKRDVCLCEFVFICKWVRVCEGESVPTPSGYSLLLLFKAFLFRVIVPHHNQPIFSIIIIISSSNNHRLFYLKIAFNSIQAIMMSYRMKIKIMFSSFLPSHHHNRIEKATVFIFSEPKYLVIFRYILLFIRFKLLLSIVHHDYRWEGHFSFWFVLQYQMRQQVALSCSVIIFFWFIPINKHKVLI